nr:hypothetical protein CFP56_78010 [Quercus suber]
MYIDPGFKTLKISAWTSSSFVAWQVASIEYAPSKLLFGNGISGLHVDQIDGRHGCGSAASAVEAVISGVVFFFAEVFGESYGSASVGDKAATFEVSNVEMRRRHFAKEGCRFHEMQPYHTSLLERRRFHFRHRR